MTKDPNLDEESTERRLTDYDEDAVGNPSDWLAEFEAASKRSLEERIRYSFIHTYKPVFDDASYRSFDSMEDYRRWCEENLPSWLGYGRN